MLSTSLAAGFLISQNYLHVERNVILVDNIEALTQSENNKPKDLWCCGTTGECLIGTNLIIVGKMSEKPC